MIPATLPQNTQDVQYMPAPDQVAAFDNPATTDTIKQFLLRAFVKREIRENEKLQVLTDVTLYDMQTNRTILGHNEDTPHFAASVNKLPITLLIMEEIKAGHITMDTTLNWQESDRRAGEGVYDQAGSPVAATVRQLLHDLLNRSGNTAARALVNGALDGAQAVNNRLAAKPDLQKTRLIPLDGNRFYMGDTTSKEALWVLRQILSQDTSYAQEIKQFLETNIYTDIGARAELAGNDYIVLVNKIGLLYDPDGNNHHDVGIIYNTKTHKSYGYSFLTTAPSTDAVADSRAIESLKDMGKYTLRYAGDKPNPMTDQVPQTLRQRSAKPEGKVLY